MNIVHDQKRQLFVPGPQIHQKQSGFRVTRFRIRTRFGASEFGRARL